MDRMTSASSEKSVRRTPTLSRNEDLPTDTFEKSHLGPVDSLDELPVGGVTGRGQGLILLELKPLGGHAFVHLDDLAIEHIGLAVSVSLRISRTFLMASSKRCGRVCVPISSPSLKPLVMTSAQRSPFRSRRALVLRLVSVSVIQRTAHRLDSRDGGTHA
jgi:hypothetical protein